MEYIFLPEYIGRVSENNQGVRSLNVQEAAWRERVNYISSTRGPKLEKQDIDTSIPRSQVRVLRYLPSLPLPHHSCVLALVKRKGSILGAGNSQRIMSTVAPTTVYYGVARAIKNAFCIMQDNQAGRVWDRCGAGARGLASSREEASSLHRHPSTREPTCKLIIY